MHKSILALCEVLDTVASTVLAVQTDNRRIPDLSGLWHTATLNREQLADIPADLAARLRQDAVEDVTGGFN